MYIRIIDMAKYMKILPAADLCKRVKIGGHFELQDGGRM